MTKRAALHLQSRSFIMQKAFPKYARAFKMSLLFKMQHVPEEVE
jgi:hypothetical protein